jgi:hypothetical protein
MEPGTRFRPLAADRDRRNPDHLRDLFQIESAEKPQFDNPCFPWIVFGQLPQGVVKGHQVAGPLVRRMFCRREIDDQDTGPSRTFRSPPRHVNQDVPHQPGRHGQEVGTVLPTDALPVQQANERFVHEGRCLKQMIRTLAPEIPAGKPAKLRFDERHEFVESGTVAFSPGGEQFRDPWRRWGPWWE